MKWLHDTWLRESWCHVSHITMLSILGFWVSLHWQDKRRHDSKTEIEGSELRQVAATWFSGKKETPERVQNIFYDLNLKSMTNLIHAKKEMASFIQHILGYIFDLIWCIAIAHSCKNIRISFDNLMCASCIPHDPKWSGLRCRHDDSTCSLCQTLRIVITNCTWHFQWGTSSNGGQNSRA